MKNIVAIGCVIVGLLLAGVPAGAQTGSAKDFYLQYRKAFDAAKKIEDLLPMMSAEVKKQIESTPAKDRPQMFEMLKMMGAITNVNVTKETPTKTGATLNVEALDPDKKKTTGTVEIVKEGGAWKVGKESWSGGM